MALRLVNFASDTAPEARVGAWTDRGIVDLAEAAQATGKAEPERFSSVVAVLSSPDLLGAARELAEEPPVELISREAVRLLAPVPQPGKLFALAGNYLAHIQEGRRGSLETAVERERRGGPRVFIKPSVDTVIGDGEPIILARTSTFVDYEAELAVIIGKSGRYIPQDEALDYVGGITALNDISERELSLWDRGERAETYRWFDWLNGKWMDTAAPMGPGAVPLAEVPDLNDLNLRLYLNNKLMQEANTGEMIFKVPEIVAYISNVCTLRPGDVIAMGTPAGVGHPRDLRLQDGDVVRIELDLVGCLTNPVQAERG